MPTRNVNLTEAPRQLHWGGDYLRSIQQRQRNGARRTPPVGAARGGR